LREADLDGDSRIDCIETLDRDGRVVRVAEAPAPGSSPSRTVVIAIDAVPFALFKRLQQEGLFREFFPAAAMVAPFPSLTNVGYTAILRTGPATGYEDRYYDPALKRMGGGVGERLSNRYKGRSPFHGAFDWEPPHLWGAAVYYFPASIAGEELSRIERILHESDEAELVLYMGSTDALGHVRGWAGLEQHLRRVDSVLKGFLASGGADRRVVLFSDHGMTTRPSRRVDLEGALRPAGFRLRSRVERSGDVVSPAFGLVGSIELYTLCEEKAAVARAVVRAQGVDFAVWRDEEGRAAVATPGGPDPRDEPEHLYPDLRFRVEEAIRNHTLHPASVLVSLEDGWHYGSSLFEALVSMKGTHGSARATSSLGFVASNVDRLPFLLRAGEVYPYLGLSREPEPPRAFVDPCRP
jgi:hypothetical protein